MIPRMLSVLLLGLAALAFVASGCATPATATIRDIEGKPHEVCPTCRDVVERYLREGKPTDATFGADQKLFTEPCADCGTDMEILEEANVWVLRCPRYAPAGIPIAPVVRPPATSP